jgi:hypothetical protein
MYRYLSGFYIYCLIFKALPLVFPQILQEASDDNPLMQLLMK